MSKITIPSPKPTIIDTIKYDIKEVDAYINKIAFGDNYLFNSLVDSLFWYCVNILKYLGEITGLGYNLLNILVFIFLQPFLILLFFYLWLSTKKTKVYRAGRFSQTVFFLTHKGYDLT